MMVTVNGARHDVPDSLTVAELLEHLGMAGDRVAIEQNFHILPRAEWKEREVRANDSFEIVHFVGGG